MKREVDRLAVTTSAIRTEIWEQVRAKFYGSTDQTQAFKCLTLLRSTKFYVGLEVHILSCKFLDTSDEFR
jgi:hypothetical protein